MQIRGQGGSGDSDPPPTPPRAKGLTRKDLKNGRRYAAAGAAPRRRARAPLRSRPPLWLGAAGDHATKGKHFSTSLAKLLHTPHLTRSFVCCLLFNSLLFVVWRALLRQPLLMPTPPKYFHSVALGHDDRLER